METGATQLLNDSSNENFKRCCQELRQTNELNNKILFINLPQFNFNAFEIEVAKNKGYYAYPPTGLQYLAQSLQGRDLDIRILDLNFELLKKIIEDENFDYKNWVSIFSDYLKNYDASVVGISNFYKIDYPAFVQVSSFLRSRERRHIIFAGAHYATYSAREFLKENLCDFICERESENKINFLLDNLFENKNHKETPGIWFRYQNKIEKTKGEPDRVELKGNLIETYKLIPIEKYCQVGSLNPYSRMAGRNKPFATILLNRGCEGNCKFCGVRDYMGGGVRTRNIQDVLDEIEYLYNKKGVRHIDWLDDDFTFHQSRTLKILQGIQDRGIKISWSCNNGFIARTIDMKLMEKMRDTGCLGFHIGIESGNPEILKKINKTGTLDIYRNFSQLARKFPEMFIIDNYIFGFPNETFAQILESYNFSLEMNLDWSSYAVYQPNLCYFGSEEEKKRIKEVNIGDFVPTKDSMKGRLVSSEKIYEGKDIFNMPKTTVPSREQLNHIWFTFNLVRNFILNKNLLPDGSIEKFISWIEVLEDRYPTHPYINFFLALSYYLNDEKNKAEKQEQKMIENLRDSYWKGKFEKHELITKVENFPKNEEQAREMINSLRKEYGK